VRVSGAVLTAHAVKTKYVEVKVSPLQPTTVFAPTIPVNGIRAIIRIAPTSI
jgi:hypothetical protein